MSRILVCSSAGIIFMLGTIHLAYTFRGRKLFPRDSALRSSMQEVSPVISDQTTMWKAWIGFNASHSAGAMLFGMVYGYLAAFAPAVLFGSSYLIAVGLATLIGLFLLARQYWFSVPFTGIGLALICYVGGVASRSFS